MLSNNLENTLKKALSIATSWRHEYATYEHLLLALIDDIDAKQVLIKNNVDLKSLNEKLTHYLKHELADLILKGSVDAKPTSGFQRIIQRATLHNQSSGHEIITGAHILVEFFFEHESYALTCLKESNLSRHDVIKFLDNTQSHLLPKHNQTPVDLIENAKRERPQIDLPQEDINDPSSQNDLEKYCVNLNKRADTNAIDCLIGRENEIERAIEILCRRKKNNAILVGEAGVGKTAIAEGMASRIVKNDVPELLKDKIIYSLDIASLIAGTRYRGDFEARIKSLLETLKNEKNAILFIDEIHTMIGAGSTTTGSLDASNLLKPALAKGELHCIGSTTFKEYNNHFTKDAALIRRFQKIVVTEPDEEASMEILKGLKGYYEKHHNVVYTDSALEAAVKLSERYINDRYLPDKAIDLIDEAGSRNKIAPNAEGSNIITADDIEELLSRTLNIPRININSDGIKQLKQLSKNLKKLIFGQDNAIDNLCSSIKLSRAGLRGGNRPTGCYLFVGPTGVGKTELAKQLAILCNMKLIKFDMSEFAESSSISKFLGSAPGYVGFEQGGILTSEVDNYPYSVVLFDEIEKAHPDIFNLLLQVMDEGTLTDSTGKHINFTHTIIILTTNLVAEEEKAPIGFTQNNDPDTPIINMDAINDQFSPEFRSRLDNIILFNPISPIVEKIVSKDLSELATQLADKKVQLKVTPSVKKHFVENCFNNNNGARELDRVIDNNIKKPIADEILFGKLINGGTASIDFSKKTQKLTFKFTGIKKVLKKQLETS